MPQYRSPGVYVEEIDAGPKPIEGVSTSICGAVGVTARGPTAGKPELVTSWTLLLTRPYCVVERFRLASARDFV
jgi:phage tail sheath protein FI